jgi:hypothetical protein
MLQVPKVGQLVLPLICVQFGRHILFLLFLIRHVVFAMLLQIGVAYIVFYSRIPLSGQIADFLRDGLGQRFGVTELTLNLFKDLRKLVAFMVAENVRSLVVDWHVDVRPHRIDVPIEICAVVI